MLIQCYQKALFPSHTNQKKQQKLQRITAKKTPKQNIISILCLRFCHIKWSVCAFNFIYLFYFAFFLSASVVVLCKCVCFSINFSVRLAVIDVHLVGLSLVDVRFFLLVALLLSPIRRSCLLKWKSYSTSADFYRNNNSNHESLIYAFRWAASCERAPKMETIPGTSSSSTDEKKNIRQFTL